jgi:hypothetical protein
VHNFRRIRIEPLSGCSILALVGRGFRASFVPAALLASALTGCGEGCASETPLQSLASEPEPSAAAPDLLVLSEPAEPSPRFEPSAGESIRDRWTGLEWDRRISEEAMTTDQAKRWCDKGSPSGWRLPARIELASIADLGATSPAADETAWGAVPPALFWSSTPVAGSEGGAWGVHFRDGAAANVARSAQGRARCVRSTRASPEARWVVRADVVEDRATLLAWQRSYRPGRLSWREAGDSCRAEAPAGWRLPSLLELLTLVDSAKRDPAIDTGTFPDASSDAFWTATPVAAYDSRAWSISFALGDPAYSELGDRLLVRCVRALEMLPSTP